MVNGNTLTELNILFRGFFKNEELVIDDETTADDIEAWDSLNHMELISAVEKRFEITFDFNEIMEFEKVGDMVIAIQTKL